MRRIVAAVVLAAQFACPPVVNAAPLPGEPQARAAGLIDVRSVVPRRCHRPAIRDGEQLRGRAAGRPPDARCLVHESLGPGWRPRRRNCGRRGLRAGVLGLLPAA